MKPHFFDQYRTYVLQQIKDHAGPGKVPLYMTEDGYEKFISDAYSCLSSEEVDDLISTITQAIVIIV